MGYVIPTKYKSVYVITNTVTNKSYVGVTERRVGVRFHEHLLKLRRGKHRIEDMQKDFDSYGESSFILRVFGRFEEKLANRLEYSVMDLINSRNRVHGYNYKDVKNYKDSIGVSIEYFLKEDA